MRVLKIVVCIHYNAQENKLSMKYLQSEQRESPDHEAVGCYSEPGCAAAPQLRAVC